MKLTTNDNEIMKKEAHHDAVKEMIGHKISSLIPVSQVREYHNRSTSTHTLLSKILKHMQRRHAPMLQDIKRNYNPTRYQKNRLTAQFLNSVSQKKYDKSIEHVINTHPYEWPEESLEDLKNHHAERYDKLLDHYTHLVLKILEHYASDPMSSLSKHDANAVSSMAEQEVATKEASIAPPLPDTTRGFAKRKKEKHAALKAMSSHRLARSIDWILGIRPRVDRPNSWHHLSSQIQDWYAYGAWERLSNLYHSLENLKRKTLRACALLTSQCFYNLSLFELVFPVLAGNFSSLAIFAISAYLLNGLLFKMTEELLSLWMPRRYGSLDTINTHTPRDVTELLNIYPHLTSKEWYAWLLPIYAKKLKIESKHESSTQSGSLRREQSNTIPSPEEGQEAVSDMEIMRLRLKWR